MANRFGEPQWRKSSRSQNGASNCVEIADLPRAAAVRDSKNPGGPVLVFAPAAFAGFLESLKD
ncbi:DUF397 domain-containing protein [Actinosynnema sp. NPDC047251]|uniref:DUF397 domain-containing protein n=1 Tax=Saccharothrix espanaensis (strain ATCC 51144 / DSM 44229 / JCM 9112 / NBRC 15066 / NRRL 15764) TaxID=1179773 RepID=K0JWK4_SACES|nr:DUF397 domain-containing protein [Saccharothrix espanaensis]CCH30436.1 hypothetical protein BN6_31310 [Saccharothrix espanaensis DSM 44229]